MHSRYGSPGSQNIPRPEFVAAPRPFESGSVATPIQAYSVPDPNYSNAYSPSLTGHVLATHPFGSVATTYVVGEGSLQGAGGYHAYAQPPPMGPLPLPHLQYYPYLPLPHYSSYHHMLISNNAIPGVQGGFPQQQLSLPYKHDTISVLSSAQKMLNAFPGQIIRPTLIVDFFGVIRVIDKHTNKCYWTAETGRSAFKFIKDKDQVLDKYFEFRGNGDRVGGLLDENKLVHVTKNGQQPVEFSTTDSMKQKLGELYGAQYSDEFEVTAKTEVFWLHCKNGDICKYRPADKDDFLKMKRSDFKIVNRVKNWDFCYSVFKLLADGDVDDVEIVHCRNYDSYITLMENLNIPREQLIVFYEKRRNWIDGRVTYEGILNTPNAGFTSVTVEHFQRAEGKTKTEHYRDKRKAEHYLHQFSHPNILNFHGAYEIEEDVFFVFESFSNDLEGCGYEKIENLGYIIRAVLSGVVHLFKMKCLHGNLMAQNVVLTADKKVKLYGLLPNAPSSIAAQEKEVQALAKLLNLCAHGSPQPLPKDYDRSKDPLAFCTLDKLNNGRVTMSQLKKLPIFWKPRRILKFIYDVTRALDARGAREDGIRYCYSERLHLIPSIIQLYNAFQVEAFQKFILSQRKSSIHKIFLENMEHASV